MLPQLNILYYPSQVFWFLLCFISIYSSLKYFFLPRLIGTIERRANIVEKKIKEAENLNIEAEKLSVQTKQLIKNAYEESDSKLSEKLSEFNNIAQSKIDKHNIELKNEYNEAKKSIDRKIELINSNKKEIVLEISSLILEKILKSKPSFKELNEIYNQKENQK